MIAVQRDAGDAGDQEQQLAIGRRHQPDHHVDDGDDAEMHGVDAEMRAPSA